jgi:hypothetical protein
MTTAEAPMTSHHLAEMLLVLSGLLILARPHAQAQQRPAVKALGQLRVSESVRVFADSTYAEGPIRRLRRDTLVLGRTPPLRSVPVSAIDSLWVRTWSSRKGAIVGAAALAGGAAFLVAMICGPDSGCNSWTTQSINAVFVGAPLGAAIGALVGNSLPSGWRLLAPT